MDAMYQFGKSTIYVVAPQITEEERKKRLNEIKQVILHIVRELSDKEEPSN